MPDPDRLQDVPLREVALPTARQDKWHQRWVWPASGRTQAVCLSDRAVLVNTHFDARAKRPRMHYCPGKPHCPFCNDQWIPFVYGYFAGQVWGDGGVYLVTLPHSSLACSKDAPKLLDNARGLVITAERTKRSPTGPVVFTVDERRADLKRIPAGWDLKADLMRRFGRLCFADQLKSSEDRRFPDERQERSTSHGR